MAPIIALLLLLYYYDVFYFLLFLTHFENCIGYREYSIINQRVLITLLYESIKLS